MAVESLRLVLGDPPSRRNAVLADVDPARHAVVMIEAPGEASHVPSHKARIALFLSAMRHFAAGLRADGLPLEYWPLERDGPPSLAGRLEALVDALSPAELVVCEPGERRVLAALQDACARRRLPLRVLPDPRFPCSTRDFARWARGRGSLRMEPFYRDMRRRHRVPMRADGEPEGGRWNFDADNRGGYPRGGPGAIPPPARFEPDAITRDAIALVEARFPGHPGSLASFGWPVERAQALEALARFVDERLLGFGRFQDAVWTDTPFGRHALPSTSLNLGLLEPREVVEAVERAWREGRPGLALASVEGFVRQVLGWREYVRGVYWLAMPGMAGAN
ncbi:MAG TPA: cryptochrome/photolyase family protein, partial [Burkholderiaceae bacterium]|nr:cryptochrome/photolyase family protein [Burkholderiaceae bacterium]